MKVRSIALALSLAVFGLAGCVAITPVPAGPLALGANRQATLDRNWSDVTALVSPGVKSVRVLSIDGPYLNRLYLVQGLTAGQSLLKAASKERPVPKFQAGMSLTEQVELIADSVSAIGYQRVETQGLRPGRFGPADGVRFEIAAMTDQGLEISGTAEVAVVEGRLYAVIYLAPKEHYFGASLPNIEALLASVS